MGVKKASLHNVLLGRIFHKTAHYTGSAIACPTAGNMNYFPQQNIVHLGVPQENPFLTHHLMTKYCISFYNAQHIPVLRHSNNKVSELSC